MPALVLHPGTTREVEFSLRPGVYVLGRARECDISVPHGSISRRHAELTVVVSPGGSFSECRVMDLGSSNGTALGGQLLADGQVGVASDGSLIRCGDLEFAYRSSGKDERPSVVIDIVEELRRTAMSQHSIVSRDTHTPAGFEEEIREQRRLLLQAADVLLTGIPPVNVEQLEQTIVDDGDRHSSHDLDGDASGGETDDVDLSGLRALADLIVDTFNADRVVLLLTDPTEDGREHDLEGRRVTQRRLQTGGSTLRPRVARAIGGGSVSPREAYSARVVDYVWQRGVGALFANVRDDVRLAESLSIPERGIRSAMAVPLATRRGALGVLYIDARRPGEVFGPAGLDVLSALASHAALTIENARLQQRWRREAVQRSQLARFFPPSVVTRLLDTPGGVGSLATLEREVTLLFCDISGFTQLCEDWRPSDVARLLNQYLPLMVGVGQEFGGTIEKYIGDALLCVFGAPYSTGADAENALRAAIGMQAQAQEFAARSDTPPGFSIHVGLATGTVAAGSIGTDDYLQYATVGAVTNLAARVCDAAKPHEIVCDQATLQAATQTLSEAGASLMSFEAMPDQPLRGLKRIPTLFRVHPT